MEKKINGSSDKKSPGGCFVPCPIFGPGWTVLAIPRMTKSKAKAGRVHQIVDRVWRYADDPSASFRSKSEVERYLEGRRLFGDRGLAGGEGGGGGTMEEEEEEEEAKKTMTKTTGERGRGRCSSSRPTGRESQRTTRSNSWRS